MNAPKLPAALAAVCLLAAGARADEKDYPKLIVGQWTVSKADAGSVPPGAVIEFTKDGKMMMSAKKDDAEIKREGTYTVDGSKVKLTLKRGDEERAQTLTVIKLTDTELSVEGEDGKKVELSKKK
jgi:uncharacterized protein (TIGR03066 family)